MRLVLTLLPSILLGSCLDRLLYLQIWNRQTILLLFKGMSSVVELLDKYSTVYLASIMLDGLFPWGFSGDSNDAPPLQAQTTSLTALGINHV